MIQYGHLDKDTVNYNNKRVKRLWGSQMRSCRPTPRTIIRMQLWHPPTLRLHLACTCRTMCIRLASTNHYWLVYTGVVSKIYYRIESFRQTVRMYSNTGQLGALYRQTTGLFLLAHAGRQLSNSPVNCRWSCGGLFNQGWILVLQRRQCSFVDVY